MSGDLIDATLIQTAPSLTKVWTVSTTRWGTAVVAFVIECPGPFAVVVQFATRSDRTDVPSVDAV